eukprot:Gb_36767 [translate_table: standard]
MFCYNLLICSRHTSMALWITFLPIKTIKQELLRLQIIA